VSDKLGRRWAIMIACTIGIFITPLYLMTTDPFWIIGGFILQALFVGGKITRTPPGCRAASRQKFAPRPRDLSVASACLLRGGSESGHCPADDDRHCGSLVILVIAVFLGPETKGKVLTADIEVLKLVEAP
jgi:SHS family lactate transporter-like MFS transporter